MSLWEAVLAFDLVLPAGTTLAGVSGIVAVDRRACDDLGGVLVTVVCFGHVVSHVDVSKSFSSMSFVSWVASACCAAPGFDYGNVITT